MQGFDFADVPFYLAWMFELIGIALMIADLTGTTHLVEQFLDRTREGFIEGVSGTSGATGLLAGYWAIALAALNTATIVYSDEADKVSSDGLWGRVFLWPAKQVSKGLRQFIGRQTHGPKQTTALQKIIAWPVGCLGQIAAFAAAAIVYIALMPAEFSSIFAGIVSFLFFALLLSLSVFITSALIGSILAALYSTLVLLWFIMHLLDKLPGKSVSALGLLVYLGSKAVDFYAVPSCACA